MIPLEWITQAETRIRPHIHETPLTYDSNLKIYIKWENQQITGSFKARGALNKILSLQKWELDRGVVTASAGNHGQGVALAAAKVNARVIVFAPEHAVEKKINAIRSLGAEIRLVAGGYEEAEKAGLAFASAERATWISPYNDGMVIAGQGTLGLESLKQEAELGNSEWVVPIGGGGLISGIGSYLSNVAPTSLVSGVQSSASPFFYALYTTGTQDNVTEKARRLIAS